VYDFKERTIGHINDYLFNAMRKVGFENFEMFPLEFCEISECAERELFWMTELKSTERNFGYNLRMDSSTGMLTTSSTSEKIRKNLKEQWASGVRDGHGEKLRKSWENNTVRRLQQSKLLSQIKTKYEYRVTSPEGVTKKCDYSQLCEMGLKNVMSTFHRKNTNTAVFKGFTIQRFSKGEDYEN